MNSSNPVNKRFFVIIGLTVLTASLIFKLHNIDPIINKMLFDFPLTIEKWKGTNIQMEDWVFESLETPYAILRDYISPDGEEINLAIVWYDDREIAFHGAAACLGGAGNKVVTMNDYRLPVDEKRHATIGKLITNKFGMQHMVLYYYISDNFLTANQIEIRKHIFLKKLKLKRTSAAFIRIMMPIIKTREVTQQKLEGFLKATLPFVIEYTDTEKALRFNNL